MPRKKTDDDSWGFRGGAAPSQAMIEMMKATKLRTLRDMSEREIRALERHYGCPVLRPGKQRARA